MKKAKELIGFIVGITIAVIILVSGQEPLEFPADLCSSRTIIAGVIGGIVGGIITIK